MKDNDIDDDQKHLILALIGAPTYKLSVTLAVRNESDDLTYKDVVDKLVVYFKPNRSLLQDASNFTNEIKSGEKMDTEF